MGIGIMLLFSPDNVDMCKFCFQTELSKCISCLVRDDDLRYVSTAEYTETHSTANNTEISLTSLLHISLVICTLHLAGHVKYSSGKHLCDVSTMFPLNFVFSFSTAW